MCPTERADYEMEFWEQFDLDRQIHSFGKVGRLRIVRNRIEQTAQEDII